MDGECNRWIYLVWEFCWIWKIKRETGVINYVTDKCKIGMMDHGLSPEYRGK